MANWTNNMPFYDDYRKAFQSYADGMTEPFEMDKPGRKKMHFETNTIYDDSATYHNMDTFRVSTNSPPPEVVYRFLFEKFGMSKNQIQNMISKLQYTAPYCELNARILHQAQNKTLS